MVNCRALIAACLLGPAAWLPAAGRDPAAVLQGAAAKVIAAAEHLPNYTCVETVTRQFYRPMASTLPRACSVTLEQRKHPTPDMMLHPFLIDRLRLDVTMSGRGEIFSWAGASKFDDEGIDHVVRYGPMGSGAFGAFLIGVFRDTASANFSREVSAGGRTLLEYAYHVPLSASKYKVKVENGWVNTGYGGSFQIDPETSEVVHLVVQTEELPEATGSCMAASTLDFAAVAIGLSQFQLPSRMSQHWVAPNGQEAENATTFSSCREYKGESTVTFFADPDAGKATTRKPTAVRAAIPDGLRFSLSLTAPITLATAAAGDIFRGALTAPLRDQHSKVLAPKGAIVEGRLLRLETYLDPPQVFVVMRPRTIEIKGVPTPFAAVRDNPRRPGVIYLPLIDEQFAGVFQFPGNPAEVPKGYRTDWRTVTP